MSKEKVQVKDTDVLLTQLDQTLAYSQSELGMSFVPPRYDNPPGKGALVQTEYESLKKLFPQRMEIYRNLLHAQKQESELKEKDRQRFGLWLKVLNRLDQYIESHQEAPEEERTLYDQQFTVFEALRDSLEQGISEGYIKLPTGTGKTVLFTEFAEAVRLKTMIVVPTRILIGQTVEKFQQFAPETQTGVIYSAEKDYTKPVTVITYDSLVKQVKEGTINPEDYELLILDEAHKSLSEKRSSIVRQFTNAIKIGFTATPVYSKDKHLENLLNTEIHTMGIREAVEVGIISSLSVFLAQTDVDLSEVRITKAGEYLDRDLDRAVNIESRNTAAIDLYKQMFAGQKAVAYCVSIAHAKDLAESFSQRGISAAVVYGKQPRAEQREVLKRYRGGEIQVLCNADILIEGFDDPETSVCLNLRPTTSPVIAEQRAGRVLRFDLNNPSKHACIVDFLDKHRNPDFFPVSFAQIVEKAHVFRKYEERTGGASTGLGTPHYPDIKITGLTVTTDAEEVLRIVKSMVEQKYPIIDELWMSLGAMKSRFRKSEYYLKKLIYPYRETHPSYLRIGRNKRGQVGEYFAPELVQIIATIIASKQEPTKNWSTVHSMVCELNVGWSTIKARVDKYRHLYPSDLEIFRTPKGRMVEHLSPRLKKIIREELQMSEPPPNSIKYGDAAKLIGMSHANFLHFLKRYKDEYSDHITRIRGPNGRFSGYISHDLFSRIAEDRARACPPPSLWIPIGELSTRLNLSIPTTRKYVNKYRDTHSHLMGTFKATGGQLAEHYSPEVESFIQEELGRMSEPEENWLSVPELARLLGVNTTTIYKAIAPYRNRDGDTESENVKVFKVTSKRRWQLALHVSPSLVSILLEKYQNLELAKPGSMVINTLAKELGLSYHPISRFVKQFRQDNPDFFQVARNPGDGKIFEFLSPELVQLVKDHFLKS